MPKSLWIILGAVAAISGYLFISNFEAPKDQSQALSEAQKIEKFQNWHEFQSPDNAFKVRMPSLPHHATENLKDPQQGSRKYEMYVAEHNGAVYMISVITMLDAQAMKIDEQVLSSVMNELLANNPDGKVKSMNMGVFQAYPAMDFSLENKDVNIDGKAFLVNNILYLLTAVSKVNSPRADDKDFFINSFELLPAGKTIKATKG